MYGQVWSSDHMIKYDQVQPSMTKCDKYYKVWPSMTRFCWVWQSVTKHDQVWLSHAWSTWEAAYTLTTACTQGFNLSQGKVCVVSIYFLPVVTTSDPGHCISKAKDLHS